MSAGHRTGAVVPDIDDAFYQRVKNLVDDCKVDRNRTIPWLANRTRNYRTVYIDLIVPEVLPQTGINTGLTLPYHELGEQLGMDEGDDYDTAHRTKGNPCEKRRVVELGGDWDAYQDEIGEYIREVDDEAMTDVPDDLDTRVFTDDHDQAALAEIAQDSPKGLRMTQRKFNSGAVLKDGALGERQIRVIASDPTPDRVKDVMVPDGCKLDNFHRNPIVLAGHDPDKPIGTAAVEVKNGRVEALITFAPPGISHTADEYCGLAKAGVLNTVSVGFEPIDVEPIKEGGLRYKVWELMELSLVSVPANPGALVIGRSAPTGKGDKQQWKVGASRNLPLDEDSSWDGPAAQKSVFDHCGFDGDSPDTSLARKAFLVYDAANSKLKGSYKLPFAKVVDGRMTAVADGIRAAASRLSQTDIPDDVQKKARAVIDHYEAKMSDGGKGGSAPRNKALVLGKNGKVRIKSLYDCCSLAQCLSALGYIHDSSKWEAEAEQDGSKLPAMLAEVLRGAAEALIAMTVEETNELLAGRSIEPLPVDEAYVAAATTPLAKSLRAGFRKAGRVLSQGNLDHLVELHKLCAKMADCYTKAADLHDDVHGIMEEWMNHGTSAGEHAKAILKSAGKKPDGSDADDGEDDGDVSDPADADNELAAAAGVRKRELELLERSAA